MFENNSLKQQVLDKITKYKKNKLFKEFLDAFYSYVPLDSADGYTIEEFTSIATEAFEYFLDREPGKSKVEISAVRRESEKEESYNCLYLINNNMPFIVDSINELLYKKKFRIARMINALIYVERNAKGKIIEIKNSKQQKPNESIIYLKILPVKTDEALNKLALEISAVLKNVRYAVSDWKAMLAKIDDSKSWLDSDTPTEDQKEDYLFLEWLKNDNFTFIGYREYNFKNGVSKEKCEIQAVDSLGVMKLKDKEFNDHLLEDVFLSDQRIWRNFPITIGKMREVSGVHRYSSFDYICIVHQENNKIVSARVFIGLFVTRLDYQSVTTIPIIRRKVEEIVERGGFDPSSFNGKELFSVVETLPRDELFQLSEDELFLTAMMILSCLNNPRLILFVRENRCKVFLNLMVFFPKSRITSDIVEKISTVIKKFIPGKFINSQMKISSMNLAYVQISLKVRNNRDLDIDIQKIEKELEKSTSLWSERFNYYIQDRLRDEKALEIIDEYKKAFPALYQANFDITEAIEDIHYIEQLSVHNQVIFRLYKRQNDKRGCLNLKAYSLSMKLDLYHIMPILENLGFNTIEEKVFPLEKKIENRSVFMQDFILDVCRKGRELDKIKANVEDAILRVYQGDLKNDITNNLISNAALYWRQVYLLNAYCSYLLQIKVPHSQGFIKQTLVKYPLLTRKIVEYFYAKFENKRRHKELKQVRAEIEKELSTVLDNLEDKVFKKLIEVVDNTLRTNYFQRDSKGELKKYISFKFDSSNISDIPLPKPYKEIFVYSSDMEGIHLRGGKVARGGLRWSDHIEDYRNEVLGLMKAQMTKNAVIVPDGSKGGFVIKNAHELHSRDEIFAEGVKAYKTFLSGLLDITDNIVNSKIISPQEVICYDEADPYLVVAADKGTATFSDIANEIANSYNFWLGDAFASGGSAGYDHKKMGITARGAWVSVEEHFKELGIDVNKEEFTTIGIGDMSGDVFGNGMLLSKHIKLIAAFNHMHIFIDPKPDVHQSYLERKRLFKMPRSQWSDYNEKLISAGGGVFSRKAKTIPVSSQMAKIFNIKTSTIEPDQLIKKILCAEFDLLWNGGIGTYVKAESESQDSVGDKPNDNVRVNGKDLRCKVVGEGGNLGFTQLGRIEFALNGGIINTDFIDNSAGVDCSDHEVNIKIAFGEALANNKLSLEKRNKLLDEMQDEVASLVLKDNLYQDTAISISLSESVKLFETKIRLIEQLQESVGLNPVLEYLPSPAEINRRSQEKIGFTRPEIAVLLAYSKRSVYKNLVNSNLPNDKYFRKFLSGYFPKLMQEKFSDEINNHQLRREIIATMVANHIINHIGTYFFQDAQDYLGAKGCDIARAYYIVWEIFKLEDLWLSASKLEYYKNRLEIFNAIRAFMQASIYWFLRNQKKTLNVEKVINIYKEGVSYLISNIASSITGLTKNRFDTNTDKYKSLNIDNELVTKVAVLEELTPSMDIINIAIETKLPFDKVTEAYFSIGQQFYYDWLLNKSSNLQANSYWCRRLNQTIKDDIYSQHKMLTLNILQNTAKTSIEERIKQWCDLNKTKVMLYNKFIDSIKCMEDIDSAKLVVAIKQGEVLIR